MSGISYIVAKLRHDPATGGLVITNEVTVDSKIESGVTRIGERNGDLFAVWSHPTRMNPEQAAEYMGRFEPDSVWVIAGDWPFELADRYLKQVRSPGRG